jgi:RND family efflux transporter MFP subunit
MKVKIIFMAVIAVLILASCGEGENAEDKETEIDNTDLVSVSEEQIKISGILTGNAEKKNMGRIIRANGILDVPPQSLVTISAPMGGFVKMTEVLQGMRVSKGQDIAQLEHQDYIQLQQDYLDSKIQMEFLSRDYEREVDLTKNNVSTVRSLNEITTRYKSLQNKVDALKNKLYLVGINADQLKEGEIKRSIPVISPIDGFITKVNVNVGKYVSSNDVMFEIVDTRHLHAEITVFEKDATYLKKDQKIKFTLSSDPKVHTAHIFLVSHSISAERTVSIHAHLDQMDPDLMPGMFVTALIQTDQEEVYALPEEAFVKFGGKNYVFVLNKKTNDLQEFQMVEVVKGVTQDGYCGFSFSTKEMTEKEIIVTKGSFDLLAKLKNNEEE